MVLMKHFLMFHFSGCTGIPGFFISAWTPSEPSISRGFITSPIDLPSPVTKIGLSAAALDLSDILSGDTGDSHLQRDEPATRPWKGGH